MSSHKIKIPKGMVAVPTIDPKPKKVRDMNKTWRRRRH